MNKQKIRIFYSILKPETKISYTDFICGFKKPAKLSLEIMNYLNTCSSYTIFISRKFIYE